VNKFRVPLTCSQCELPIGYLLEDGRIQIGSRHHGEKHQNVLELAHLVKLAIDYRLISNEALFDIRDLAGRAVGPFLYQASAKS